MNHIRPCSILHCLKCKLLLKIRIQIRNLHALLRHRIAVTDGHAAVGLGFEIIGYAERRADLIQTAVSLTDISSVVILAVVLPAEMRVDFPPRLPPAF